MQRELPIVSRADDIVSAARGERRLVVTAPTGSGKSTKLPQMLLDSGSFPDQIVVLEPRRLAPNMAGSISSPVRTPRSASMGDIPLNVSLGLYNIESPFSRPLGALPANPLLSGVGMFERPSDRLKEEAECVRGRFSCPQNQRQLVLHHYKTKVAMATGCGRRRRAISPLSAPVPAPTCGELKGAFDVGRCPV